MFNFADCVNKFLCWPLRYPIAGSNKLVTYFSLYSCCTHYGLLKAVYRDMEIRTFNCTLLLLLLLPVLRTISEWVSWVMFSVAALAASQWTNWCLHCRCVWGSARLDEAPIDWLDSDPLTPSWGISFGMIWGGWIGVEDDNEKFEVLTNIKLASGQSGISNSQLARSTHDESYCG